MTATERRQRERERRRAEILEAAARAFSDRGVEHASMESIAIEAELGKATLYYYFKTKEELHAAVLQEGTERFFGQLMLAEAAGDDLADLVESLLQNFVRFCRDNPELLKVMAPYLAHAHWVGQTTQTGDEENMPRHAGFISTLMERLGRSPWAADPRVFLIFLNDTFAALAARFVSGHADDADAQVAFYLDLLRSYRAVPHPAAATVEIPERRTGRLKRSS